MSDRDLRERLLEAFEDDSIILAILLAERLIADGSEEGWVFEIYADMLIAIGRYDDAETALSRVEHFVSEERRAWVTHRRAELEKERGNFQAALDLWKAAHSQKPDEGTFPVYASTMAHRLGRLHEAEVLARIGTQCAQGSPDEAWYNLGGYLAAQERYDEAYECYERAIEIDPDDELAIRRRQELIAACPQKWAREPSEAGEPC